MIDDEALAEEPTVIPSWKSEFIHGYGCGLFGGVDP